MIEWLRDAFGAVPTHLRGLLVRDLHLKVIALLLTFAVYLWVNDDLETQIIAPAPLRLSIPEDQVLLEPDLETVDVTLRGRRSTLDQFDRLDMQPVTLELTPSDDETLVPITPDDVEVPAGLSVVSIEPRFIRVDMEERVEKEVDVQPRIVGQTRRSYVVGDIRVTPSTVTISGPERVVGGIDAISTESIDVTGRARTFQKQVQLRPRTPDIEYERDEPITVTVPIRTEEVRRTFEELEVTVVNTAHATSLEPTTLDLTVRGPRALIQDLEPETIHAVIDLSGRKIGSTGTFEREVTIRNLPDMVEIVRLRPRRFLVTARAPETTDERRDAGASGETASP